MKQLIEGGRTPATLYLFLPLTILRRKMYYLVAVRRMDLSPMHLFAENAAAFFLNAAAFFLNAAAFCLKYRGVWEDGRRSVKK